MGAVAVTGRALFACGADSDGFPVCMGDGGTCGPDDRCTRLDPNHWSSWTTDPGPGGCRFPTAAAMERIMADKQKLVLTIECEGDDTAKAAQVLRITAEQLRDQGFALGEWTVESGMSSMHLTGPAAQEGN